MSLESKPIKDALSRCYYIDLLLVDLLLIDLLLQH